MNVSVIIPVYNAEAYVEQAVQSALDQPETGEVLLIEDGSPDGSLAVCQRLDETYEKVRLLRHAGGANRGAGASRNLGVQSAKYDWIAFLDADDYMLPGRLRQACEILGRSDQVDGVYEAVGTECTTEAMREWWTTTRRGLALTTVRERVEPEELFDAILDAKRGCFCTDGIVVRRSLIERVGFFDPALRMCQDMHLWLRLAAMGRLVGGSIDEPVAMRRVHGENRIFKHQAEHRRYSIQMMWSLLRWGRRNGLSADRMNALVASLASQYRWEAHRNWGPIARRAVDALFIAKLVFQYPASRHSPHVKQIAAHLVPSMRLLRMMPTGR